MRIAVVTPTLDAGAFLHECVRTVDRQRDDQLEVDHIVVDGGSRDDTLEIAHDAGCRVIEAVGTGIFEATNIGTRAADADLVGFLGADDTLVPRGLRAVAERHLASGRAWVVGAYEWVDGDNRSRGRIAPPPRWLSASMLASMGWCWINHMATYVTPRLFDELGGFDTSYRDVADHDFFVRALDREPWSAEPATVARFRRHGANNSMQDTARYRAEVARVSATHGAPSPRRRAADRAIARIWVNATNPVWAARKFLDRSR